MIDFAKHVVVKNEQNFTFSFEPNENHANWEIGCVIICSYMTILTSDVLLIKPGDTAVSARMPTLSRPAASTPTPTTTLLPPSHLLELT